MKKVWNWIKDNPNRSMFLLPILLVAAISISHVVSWYDMANPINWAIYLSIAIEVAAITALVAATNKIKGGIWFMFGIVTFIQMIGNIFYSFKEIDETGELFKSWIELTGPVWELMGTETTDLVGMKRWLAFLEGGLLPIISLTSLHFFVKYEKPEEDTYNPMTNNPEDVYYPEKTKDSVVFSKPEGKEFNVAYPLSDEIMREISEMPTIDIEEDNIEERIVIEKDDLVEVESEVEEEESKAESVKATTPPSINGETDSNSSLVENALKKYKESKDRTVNQPVKPVKTNIKRID